MMGPLLNAHFKGEHRRTCMHAFPPVYVCIMCSERDP